MNPAPPPVAQGDGPGSHFQGEDIEVPSGQGRAQGHTASQAHLGSEDGYRAMGTQATMAPGRPSEAGGGTARGRLRATRPLGP